MWVDGDRKCTLSTMTVTIIDSVTRIIVNSRYLPMSGTTSDVGGMISASSRKNTVSDSRIEIHSDIFSPVTQTHSTTVQNTFDRFPIKTGTDKTGTSKLAHYTNPNPNSKGRVTLAVRTVGVFDDRSEGRPDRQCDPSLTLTLTLTLA